MVPKKFLKQRKVFGKVESERIPMRKVWNHAIDLKETFKPKKGRIYLLSKDEREEVQKFVNDQLRKGYIRPSKSSQILPVFFVAKKDRSKRIVVTNFIQTITPGILDRFQQSKWPPKALKKTF